MISLPNTKELGPLSFVKMLVEFDGPQLFVCQHDRKQLFLASLIDTDYVKENWVYVPITRDCFNNLESGRTDVRTAMLCDRDRVFFRVTSTSGGHEVVRDFVRNMTDRELPDLGVYVNFDADAEERIKHGVAAKRTDYTMPSVIAPQKHKTIA